MSRRLTRAQKIEIVAAHERGETCEAIARRLGCDLAAPARVVEARGLALHPTWARHAARPVPAATAPNRGARDV